MEGRIPNGHCLINRSDGDAVFIEVGTRAASERAHYPDVDLGLSVMDRRRGIQEEMAPRTD